MGNLVSLCRRHHRYLHEYGFTAEVNGSEVLFRRPDGRIVPSVPANERVAAEDGVRALKSGHERRGIAITARTGVPKWFGERMDYGEAVGALRDRERRSRKASSPQDSDSQRTS